MKLLYVVDHGFECSNDSNFTTNGNLAMVNRLLKYFEHITIISRDRKINESSRVEIHDKRVEVIQLKNFTSVSEYLKVVQYNKRIIYVNIMKTDIVFGLGFNGSIAIKLAKKCNKKAVAYVGGSGILTLKNAKTYKERIKALCFHMKQLQLTKNASYVQYVAEFLRQEYPTKGDTMICSSIKIPSPTEIIRNQRLNKVYTQDSGVKIGIIGYVHTPIKGIDTAIKALKELDNRFVLEVVGRGDHSWLDNIADELHIGERIKYLGELRGGEEIYKWLDSVDIYIQPSISEGMPRATIEAMYRGCPVIATSVGGLSELVKKECLIEPHDFRGLANLIKKIEKDKELRVESILENLETAESFSEDNLQKKYDAFWSMITATSHN